MRSRGTCGCCRGSLLECTGTFWAVAMGPTVAPGLKCTGTFWAVATEPKCAGTFWAVTTGLKCTGTFWGQS
jgi:hypothetical protein